ncbi:50S ribosomal protein L11 methyltransferase [Thermosynechococcus sp. QS41]|uniref:50S ribosomal protein L11 methyltransferase n=1 Tax=Thermosynechococcus sp. QS41 TaxID=3074101 RepID=UPI00287732E4|nr:50S ribosomal protein L11 methyltransferase [Thermosynechococcus sp. QS41]WNC60460.1 50S ribosomal protein L11 methyltransferase [Thermosynechococcus sp. QS41]
MVQRWWEITVTCQAEAEELVYWRLQSFGCQGTATQQQQGRVLIQGYVPQQQVTLLDIAALGVWIEQDVVAQGYLSPKLHWQLVNEQDWAHSWQAYWHPIPVGDRLLICPAWETPPLDNTRLVIKLDPGMAFGTGTHETTQLCLEALEMQLDQTFEPLPPTVMADIGCGSGILAIASLLLGANKAYAVDTSDLAVTATQRNAELNGIRADQLIVKQGSWEQVLELVDGLVCNILAPVIIEILPHLPAIVKPKGWGIFSGILLDQADRVAEQLEQQGWSLGSVWRRHEWCCLNARFERLPD